MKDWISIAAPVLCVIATALINSRVSAARYGERVANHGRRLDQHDLLHKETTEKFANLKNEFLPRAEADLQFKALTESHGRIETYLRYLVFGERPAPPSV
jgi:hypothetical protein